MVNEEFKEKVRNEYGLCECGNDVEWIIDTVKTKKHYHINIIGEALGREIKKSESISKAYCADCYLKERHIF